MSISPKYYLLKVPLEVASKWRQTESPCDIGLLAHDHSSLALSAGGQLDLKESAHDLQGVILKSNDVPNPACLGTLRANLQRNARRGTDPPRAKKTASRTLQLPYVPPNPQRDRHRLAAAVGPKIKDDNLSAPKTVSQSELRDVLILLFSRHTYWRTSHLQQHVRCSRDRLERALRSMAFYHTSGPHSGHWRLQPQLQTEGL